MSVIGDGLYGAARTMPLRWFDYLQSVCVGPIPVELRVCVCVLGGVCMCVCRHCAMFFPPTGKSLCTLSDSCPANGY